MKKKCLLVICTLWIFVCTDGFSVKMTVDGTVSVLRKLHSSTVCFVHSDQKGKPASIFKYCDFSTQHNLSFLHQTYVDWASSSNGIRNAYKILMRDYLRCLLHTRLSHNTETT